MDTADHLVQGWALYIRVKSFWTSSHKAVGNTLLQTEFPTLDFPLPRTGLTSVHTLLNMSILNDEKHDLTVAGLSINPPTAGSEKIAQEAGNGVVLPELKTSDPPPNSSKRKEEYIQFAALCFSLFLAGWNDGTTGPLLNRIKSVYHVNIY